MQSKRLLVALVMPLVLAGGFALGAALNRSSPRSDIVGLPDDTAIEYGTVTIDAKWQKDQTTGSAIVTFKTHFAEPPIVVANQYGRGGWHFFVHAVPTRDRLELTAMLDRSFQGAEPRQHPCQVAYVAIGKRAK